MLICLSIRSATRKSFRSSRIEEGWGEGEVGIKKPWKFRGFIVWFRGSVDQDQIIPMNDFRLVDIAKNGLDFRS